jgi:hypothetical protein
LDLHFVHAVCLHRSQFAPLLFEKKQSGPNFSTGILQQYEARGDFMKLLLVMGFETKRQSSLCKKNDHPENQK